MADETLPRETTAEEVEACVLGSGLDFIVDHDCALCQVDVGYRIIDNKPYFDCNCGCSSRRAELSLRTWESMAETVNMQTSAQARYNVAKRFHIDLDKPFTPEPLTHQQQVEKMIMGLTTHLTADQCHIFGTPFSEITNPDVLRQLAVKLFCDHEQTLESFNGYRQLMDDLRNARDSRL